MSSRGRPFSQSHREAAPSPRVIARPPLAAVAISSRLPRCDVPPDGGSSSLAMTEQAGFASNPPMMAIVTGQNHKGFCPAMIQVP
jgi:hypothetical protein